MVSSIEPRPHITFVIRDVEGGVASMNHQILENADFAQYFQVHILLWAAEEDTPRGFTQPFNPRYEISRFRFSRSDNYFHTLKAFSRQLNQWPGILVTNDGIELQALRRFGTTSTLFSIVHDFYNLKLAIESIDLVDYFICHTETFTRALLSCYALSQRVKFLLHGVKVMPPRKTGTLNNGTLKIISISRLAQAKGVSLLFDIDKLLEEKGFRVEWMIVGGGELETHLKQQWLQRTNVTFYHPERQEEVMKLAASADIFISPSQFEGYGIALLEAMSCGLVPVISRLPVGLYADLPDHVGFSVASGDAKAFAGAIISLYEDRQLLANMSADARRLVGEKYDITRTAPAFLEFFRSNSAPRIDKNRRLDQTLRTGMADRPFVPNKLTRLIRKIRH